MVKKQPETVEDPIVESVEPEPENKFVTFRADPGYTLVGYKFPIVTDDEGLIETIRKGRGFRSKKIWEDTRTAEDVATAEVALKGLNYNKLVSMARRLGVRFTDGMTKLELLECIEKEGAR